MTWIVNGIPVADGWEIRLLDATTGAAAVDPATGAAILPVPRRLLRLKTKAGDFPYVTADGASPDSDAHPADAVPVPATDPALAALCAGAEPETMMRLHRQVVAQSIDAEGMKTWGRYLFCTLLGEATWRAIDAASKGCIELMLEWPPEETALNRLPWEMMHSGDDFLAARPRYALSRRVAVSPDVAAANKAKLQSFGAPPRVLFVIGAGMGDAAFDALKPGAEYLGILRGLRQGALGLNHLPLVGASALRLQATVESYQPDVVHFICHGEPNGTLELVDDDRPEARHSLDAAALHALLHPPGVPSCADPAVPYGGPQIAVLSACHSAADGGYALEDVGQVSFPLAVDLVRKGIPLVIGMAGEVADAACRLFSRSFYESLLSDGRVGCAAARGRRAGLLYGHDGRSSLDWALPCVFVSSALAEPRVTIQARSLEAPWHRLAQELACDKFPAYYARLDVARQFELLMADGAMQLKLDSRKSDLQVLGLSTRASPEHQLGRSRTLRDLAAKAARNGHVPLVIDEDLAVEGDWPKDIENFISYIVRASRATLVQLGDPDGAELDASAAPAFVWKDTFRTIKLKVGETPPDDLPEEIRSISVIGNEYERQDMIAMAMQLDMMRYLDHVRALYGHRGAKLLLLIDDLHEMGDAVAFLVKRLFATSGLRAQARRRDDVRVLFTYSQLPRQAGQTSAVKTIVDFLSEKPYAKDIELSEFRAGTEADMAYAHVLYKWQVAGEPVSLVPIRSNRESVKWLFDELRLKVGGVPSRLTSSDVVNTIDSTLRFPLHFAALRRADDEDALSKTDVL